MADENKVGEKIRQLREGREMSCEELAEASQSSVELIEKLENGASLPSLTPLLNIARALGVRLGTFMDDAPQTGPFVVKAGSSKSVTHFSGKNTSLDESVLDFYSLAYGKSDRHMEPFIIDVHPPKTGEYELASHEGEEFIYVMSGEIEVLYGQESYVVGEGDSIYYDSIVPHDLHANGDDAKILAVVYTPF
ncbi:helix-turn-helix domain-containing protein [Methanobacterium aggregans]|uniref:helix-turn-helix domain-containing protein n=1 Tax=Methanobacterium aggregans TaxID=1615586 RepID=UPI001AE29E03|nr:XRE family transcriptional regulator [Methanobacterium aggregans]MBP2045489.1 transcriptional regulator with XRE-family HTH domain [Methanobacterium aggregans]